MLPRSATILRLARRFAVQGERHGPGQRLSSMPPAVWCLAMIFGSDVLWRSRGMSTAVARSICTLRIFQITDVAGDDPAPCVLFRLPSGSSEKALSIRGLNQEQGAVDRLPQQVHVCAYATCLLFGEFE